MLTSTDRELLDNSIQLVRLYLTGMAPLSEASLPMDKVVDKEEALRVLEDLHMTYIDAYAECERSHAEEYEAIVLGIKLLRQSINQEK